MKNRRFQGRRPRPGQWCQRRRRQYGRPIGPSKGPHVADVASARNEEFVAAWARIRKLTSRPFVNYTAHADLAAHLGSVYATTPFDHVLDCVGVQAFYAGSPAYLKRESKVINVGAMNGMVMAFVKWIQNLCKPVWLGGMPRQYIMFSTIPTRDNFILLLMMIGDGEFRVNLDSVWEMEDVAKGCERVTCKRSRGKAIVKVHDDV